MIAEATRKITLRFPMAGIRTGKSFSEESGEVSAFDIVNLLPGGITSGNQAGQERARGVPRPSIIARSAATAGFATASGIVNFGGVYNFSMTTGSGTSYGIKVGAGTVDPSSLGTHFDFRSTIAVINGIGYSAGGSQITPTAANTATVAGITITAGSFPANMTIAAPFMGRLVVAHGTDASAVHLSRIGAPGDWDYSRRDPAAAIALNAFAATTGRANSAVTALCPVTNDTMLIAGENVIVKMMGDPGSGGRVVPVSESYGILGPEAWCATPDGSVYFLWFEEGYESGSDYRFSTVLMRLRPDNVVEDVSRGIVSFQQTRAHGTSTVAGDGFEYGELIQLFFDPIAKCVWICGQSGASGNNVNSLWCYVLPNAQGTGGGFFRQMWGDYQGYAARVQADGGIAFCAAERTSAGAKVSGIYLIDKSETRCYFASYMLNVCGDRVGSDTALTPFGGHIKFNPITPFGSDEGILTRMRLYAGPEGDPDATYPPSLDVTGVLLPAAYDPGTGADPRYGNSKSGYHITVTAADTESAAVVGQVYGQSSYSVSAHKDPQRRRFIQVDLTAMRGRSLDIRQRVRGRSFAITLDQEADGVPWAFEYLELEFERAGPSRRG